MKEIGPKRINANLVDLQTKTYNFSLVLENCSHKKTPVKERKIMQNGKYIVLNLEMEDVLKGIIKTTQRHNAHVNCSLNTFINFLSTCTQNV